RVSLVFLQFFIPSVFFFFFQAEDGIRDATVTGVQTCALPISDRAHVHVRLRAFKFAFCHFGFSCWAMVPMARIERATSPLPRERSEERRVGKECRGGWLGWSCKRRMDKVVAYVG